MNPAAWNFDGLDLFDADIVSVSTEPPDKLVVRLKNVAPISGRPEVTAVSSECRLIIDGVTRSVRRFRQYRLDSTKDDFLPPRVVEDLPVAHRRPDTRDFILEGRLCDPAAWALQALPAAPAPGNGAARRPGGRHPSLRESPRAQPEDRAGGRMAGGPGVVILSQGRPRRRIRHERRIPPPPGRGTARARSGRRRVPRRRRLPTPSTRSRSRSVRRSHQSARLPNIRRKTRPRTRAKTWHHPGTTAPGPKRRAGRPLSQVTFWLRVNWSGRWELVPRGLGWQRGARRHEPPRPRLHLGRQCTEMPPRDREVSGHGRLVTTRGPGVRAGAERAAATRWTTPCPQGGGIPWNCGLT